MRVGQRIVMLILAVAVGFPRAAAPCCGGCAELAPRKSPGAAPQPACCPDESLPVPAPVGSGNVPAGDPDQPAHCNFCICCAQVYSQPPKLVDTTASAAPERVIIPVPRVPAYVSVRGIFRPPR